MYVPPRFRVNEVSKLHSFIEQNSFATLITNTPEITASHVPLLLERDEGESGQLIGHLAKANDQWQGIDGDRCLAIFTGPHAYISPTWYEEQNVVPTWNYVAVHAHGRMYLETQKPQILDIVRRTTDFYEASMEVPWTVDLPETDFIDKIADQVVGFRVEIDRLEGNWKLNQHHSAERKAKIIAALRETGEDAQTAVADLMQNAK